ncbi:MAG: MoxR family ATPase, partial [Oscillospiraceae bacterium]|nr:MoxR family ATPase [Oscillospiraceae bacterium]
EKIVRVHFGSLDETLLRQAMEAFYFLRGIDGIEKKPSTSELVDWIRALELGGVDPARIRAEIPFAGVLLKKDKDVAAMERRLGR